MRYILYDLNEKPVSEGPICLGTIMNIPTGGSISIEVADGIWIQFGTTEWGGVSVANKPEFGEMPEQPVKESVIDRIKPLGE